MDKKKKWKVSVWCIQYGFGGEFIWSIPDDIFYAETYETATKMNEDFLAGKGYENAEVHRCEIEEVEV